jgi:septum formation protein
MQGKEAYSFYVETKVKFKDINEFELNLYLNSKDSLDKAGSYGIQGQAQLFIDSLNGSYSNVVGLPIAEVLDNLKSILNTQDLKSLF